MTKGMMVVNAGLAVLGTLAFSVQAGAKDFDSKYYTIGDTQVTMMEEGASGSLDLQSTNAAVADTGDTGDIGGAVKEVNVIVDEVINIGSKIWKIVDANKPVVNYASVTANAVPKGVQDWTELQGWQIPHTAVYKVEIKNLYKATVVSFSYRVEYTFGGNYDGKGLYLTNVTVVPANLYVAWGWTFNASASVPSVVNVGTRLEPIAGATVALKYSVDTALCHSESTNTYFVRGDGQLTDLSQGRM